MKQLIVMISMIMLGIAIAGIVSGFGDKAVDISKVVSSNLDNAHLDKQPTGTGK